VPESISSFYAKMHSEHSVRLHCCEEVVAIEERPNASVVLTGSGMRLPADIVVIGIGSVPNDELAASCGLSTDRGVIVDEFGFTNDPEISAAGDVARHFNPLLGKHILLESWQNAQNQAIAVARNVVGTPTRYAEIPWFWTDQYDCSLQIYGLPDDNAQTIVRGDLATRKWLLVQMRDDKIIYAAGANCPRELRICKDLISRGRSVSARDFANTAVDLKSLVSHELQT